jgi:hypothetical protein
MAVTATTQTKCPECGLDVPVTLTFQSTRVEGSLLISDSETDLTDVTAHTWTHEP